MLELISNKILSRLDFVKCQIKSISDWSVSDNSRALKNKFPTAIQSSNTDIDLLFSAFMFNYTNIDNFFLEAKKRLKSGILLFGGLAKGSLLALNDGFEAPEFTDIHTIGDAMIKNGFQSSVIELESMTLEYILLEELKILWSPNNQITESIDQKISKISNINLELFIAFCRIEEQTKRTIQLIAV